jgi:hypothetical protein
MVGANVLLTINNLQRADFDIGLFVILITFFALVLVGVGIWRCFIK